MNNRSKGRGRPSPDANNIKHIIYELEKALIEEDKVTTNLFVVDQKSGEDALQARDGAVKQIRFLKVWFELPSQVFLTAINLLDRFLTKMKVKQTYLPCASISCLYVASELHKCKVNAKELVIISETNCKVNDVERMSQIIRAKLELNENEPPTTVYNYLDHYLRILEAAANALQDVKSLFHTMIKRKNLLTRMEVVMLDSQCASIRPSIVALAMIQTEMERILLAEIPSTSPYYSLDMYTFLTVIYELQIISMMAPNQFMSCYSKIKTIIQNYDDNLNKSEPVALPRMNWRYSMRKNSLKPSENFYTNLCIIREY